MNRLLIFLIFTLSVLPVIAQEVFDIEKFTNPTKYGWQDFEDRMNYRYDITERQKLLHIYEMESQSITSNMLKSAFVPGWGQFTAKQYTKGQIILGIELAFIGGTLYFYDKSMDYYKQYKNSTQITDINNYYKKAQTPYEYSIVFLTFASVIWIYNVFDVIQSTEAYNSELWEKTMKRHYKFPVEVTPSGIQYRF